MIKSKRVLAAALVAALGLTAAACGDDDEEATPDDRSTRRHVGRNDTRGHEAPEGTEAPRARKRQPAPTAPDGTTATPAEGVTVGLLFDITGRGDKSFNDPPPPASTRPSPTSASSRSESTPTGDADRADRLNLLVERRQRPRHRRRLPVDRLARTPGPPPTPTRTSRSSTRSPSINNGTPDDTTDDADSPNVASLVFAEEQGSFLVGAAAALKSQTGKIGFVGGVEIDLIKKFEAGYVAGAKAVNPDIEILSKYVVAAAGLHRLQRPGQGQGDRRRDVRRRRRRRSTTPPAAPASACSRRPPRPASPARCGPSASTPTSTRRPTPSSQPYILTSMLKRVDVAVYETIKADVDGTFAPGVQRVRPVGRRRRLLDVGRLRSTRRSPQLDDFKAQIISGEIVVPTAP